MRISTHLFLIFLFSFPLWVQGAVRISEVAWMGSQESANDEWIELHNDGTAAVDLQGWRLATDDGGIEVALSGIVPAGGYFLLERTDDESVPSVTADMLYTGSLANGGEVLRLFRPDGDEADKVDGSDEWGIGGDNVTKETLQRADGRWVTAPPTPKAPYAEGSRGNGKAPPKESEKKSGGDTQGNSPHPSRNKPKYLEDIAPLLSVALEAPERAAPGARVSFNAVVYDQKGEEVYAPLQILWNFGDGTVGEGKEAEHVYRYPGEYVVRVRAVWNRFGTELTAEARRTLTVAPLNLALLSYGEEYTDIANREAFEVDLSDWTLVRGGSMVRIPALTTLLPARTLRLRHAPMELSPPILFDAEKNIAATSARPRRAASLSRVAPERRAREGAAAGSASAPFTPLALQASASPEERVLANAPAQAALAARAAPPLVRASESGAVWYWALAGLVALGIFAALLQVPAPLEAEESMPREGAPHRGGGHDREAPVPPPSAREFTLIEEGEKRG